MAGPITLSNHRVNWAGNTLREYVTGRDSIGEHLPEAVAVISEYRKAHAHALQTIAANLRYYVDKHTQARPLTVGQRLKRLPTLVDKLSRHPHMQLARMQDIGGCRAVVGDEIELRAIVTHLQRRWSPTAPAARARILREYDYIAEPKPDGYRAYHLVIRKESRLIEVQLRTTTQHAWAELIEATDRRHAELELKSGYGPADLLEYYRLGAEMLASREASTTVSAGTLKRFRELHEKVSPWLSQKTT